MGALSYLGDGIFGRTNKFADLRIRQLWMVLNQPSNRIWLIAAACYRNIAWPFGAGSWLRQV